LKLLHEISLIYNTRDISPSAKTCNLFGQYNEERKQWRMHDLSEGVVDLFRNQKNQNSGSKRRAGGEIFLR